jgi:citrate lyase beta subunit
MINTYFFIPASSPKFLSNINKINADFIVFDLEDAIEKDDISHAIKNLADLEIKDNHWVRFPFAGRDKTNLEELKKTGIKNFIVPKVQTGSDFYKIVEQFDNKEKYAFIILIENPLLLINLSEFIEQFHPYLKGIGLGSHDYTSEMNMQHDFDNLYFARNIILNHAKANKLKAIDIASMKISDEEELQKEFISAVRMGFDAKFFIHPKQLEVFRQTKFFSDSEITEAKEVNEILKNQSDYAAFKYNGKVYEKPHLLRLKRIKDWAEKYERI